MILIDNCLKFAYERPSTASKIIQIELEKCERDLISITITDDGEGINLDLLSVILEQIENPRKSDELKKNKFDICVGLKKAAIFQSYLAMGSFRNIIIRSEKNVGTAVTFFLSRCDNESMLKRVSNEKKEMQFLEDNLPIIADCFETHRRSIRSSSIGIRGNSLDSLSQRLYTDILENIGSAAKNEGNHSSSNGSKIISPLNDSSFDLNNNSDNGGSKKDFRYNTWCPKFSYISQSPKAQFEVPLENIEEDENENADGTLGQKYSNMCSSGINALISSKSKNSLAFKSSDALKSKTDSFFKSDQ